MSKQNPAKDQPITAQDMADFVNSSSDFAFEMQVLARLNALGFQCSHSGTYRDPVTRKIRQFDIRAVAISGDFQLAMAVECKSLRPNFPLLISAVPRTVAEAFNDRIVLNRELSSTSVEQGSSMYKVGEMVGKKSDQVKKDPSSGVLTSNDEATFDKVNQAVNSCSDLVSQFAFHNSSRALLRVVLPLLVVPAGTLWQVDYAADGNLQKPPQPESHSNLYLNTAWLGQTGVLGQTISYRLSHMEFVTFDVLADVVSSYIRPCGLFS
jgi:hypothetical protein